MPTPASTALNRDTKFNIHNWAINTRESLPLERAFDDLLDKFDKVQSTVQSLTTRCAALEEQIAGITTTSVSSTPAVQDKSLNRLPTQGSNADTSADSISHGYP